jgi:hypothetical protein
VGIIFVVVAAQPGARAWGLPLRLWAGTYPVYLLAVTAPTPSILRYLMLAAAPLWPLPAPIGRVVSATSRTMQRMLLVGLVGLGLLGQWWWTTHVFTVATSPEAQLFP